jgi:hypothetical protein
LKIQFQSSRLRFAFDHQDHEIEFSRPDTHP